VCPCQTGLGVGQVNDVDEWNKSGQLERMEWSARRDPQEGGGVGGAGKALGDGHRDRGTGRNGRFNGRGRAHLIDSE
jgi:hypothetical protein